MNFRLTAFLFGGILVLGLVVLGMSIFDSSSKPDTDVLPEELAHAAIKPDQVDTVEIERPGTGTLKIRRTEKGWMIDEPFTARADSTAVSSVINALFRARPTAHGELTANPAAHGLEPPGLRVILRHGDKSSSINLGNVTIGSRAVVFVTTSARKRPMAVQRADLDPLFRESLARAGGKAGDMAKWTSDYRVKSVFPSDTRMVASDVQAVTLTSKKKTLALKQTPSGWVFEEPKGWGDAATAGADPATPGAPPAGNFTGVTPLLNSLTALQAQSADDFIEQPKDLKEYGLNPEDPDRIEVELTQKDGSKVTAFIGKKADPPLPKDLPKDLKLPPMSSGKVYVMVKGDAGVIRASGSNLDGLAAVIADPTPLRDRTLLAADKNRIDAVDVTVGTQTVKLRRRGGQFGAPGTWELYGGTGDPQKAGEATVNALLDVLTERRTIKDFPATNDANFAGPELKAEVKLWADGIDAAASTDPKAEPKLKGNPYVLQFGKKEGDTVYVRRTLPAGGKADFILPQSVLLKGPGGAGGTPVDVLAAATKTRLDYLDPELKSFGEAGSANKLTIARGPQVTEVAQDEKSVGLVSWKYAQPEPMKGKEADPGEVSSLLRLLAFQRALRFIDEQPTDAKLVEYGLDPKGPVMRVTVGLKSETDKERVYDLGKETTDGNIYARQQGRAAVFTLPKEVFNRFANADLRDKTVVRFDKAKVKGLKLRGWFSTGGAVTTLEFERKGAEWVAKTPKDFNIDSTKVNMFVALLDGLKARAFVPGGQKPEHGFPPEQQGFEVTLELEGAPGIVLNIAAPADGGTNYYGWTNDPLAGNSVFTVPADLFKVYKEKPAAFAK